MAKRIKSEINKRLFQLRPNGNYYTYVGGEEITLETNDIDKATKHLTFLDNTSSFFGPAAFKYKVKDLFPIYLDEKKKGVRLSTFKEYEKMWRIFEANKIASVRLAEVTQTVWDAFCDRGKHNISDFQNSRNLMHNFLVWCSRKEFIRAVPSFENPKHKRRKRKIIPPEHLNLLFQNAHGSLLLFMSMALFMGMRRSEIMKLTWKRMDLVERFLILTDEDVKTDDGREVPLNNVVHGLLTQRLKEHQDVRLKSPWVFPNENDPKRHADVGGLKTAWRTCLKRSGLIVESEDGKKIYQYSFHDFRATYELYSNLSKDFTDTQKEKMVGAQIDVQKRIYVSMKAKHLRGLEEVVSREVPELIEVVSKKTAALNLYTGNRPVKKSISDLKKLKRSEKSGA